MNKIREFSEMLGKDVQVLSLHDVGFDSEIDENGETFFDNADIKNSIFEHCNLERASFAGTNLEKVDFSTAFNFSINPAACKLKKTVFSEDNLRGLVDHLNIIIK